MDLMDPSIPDFPTSTSTPMRRRQIDSMDYLKDAEGVGQSRRPTNGLWAGLRPSKGDSASSASVLFRRRPALLTALLALAFLFLASSPVAMAERTNYCDRAAALRNGTIPSIRQALTGMSPTMAVFNASNPAYMVLSPTGRPQSGFLYEVLEAVAFAGGFEWNYVLTPNPPTNVTDDMYYKGVTEEYDSVAKLGFDTSIRRGLGMSFTPALLEASLVLIINTDVQRLPPPNDFWIWLYPFEWALWAAVMIAIIVHAIAQVIIDRVEIGAHAKEKQAQHYRHMQENGSLHPGPKEAEMWLYDSFLAFTNANENARKRSARTLWFFFLFFLFVMCAAYSANLTSVLILQNTSGLQITGIQDANNNRATVCFRKGSAAINLVTSVYPQIQVVTTESATNNAQVLDYLQEGRCDAGVLAYNDWQIVGYGLSNVKCNLQLIGPNIRDLTVSLPYKVDYTELCTSTFGDAFSALITQLTEAFTIQTRWTATLDLIRPIKDPDCLAKINGNANANNQLATAQLTFTFYQGLFIFYAVVIVAVVAAHFIGSAFDWEKLFSRCNCCRGKKAASSSTGMENGNANGALNSMIEVDTPAKSAVASKYTQKENGSPYSEMASRSSFTLDPETDPDMAVARKMFKEAYAEMQSAMEKKYARVAAAGGGATTATSAEGGMTPSDSGTFSGVYWSNT